MEIKKYLKIYWQLVKFAFITETEYRVSFILEWFVEVAYIIVTVVSIQVLFWNIKEVAGWDFNELLVLMGINAIFSEIALGISFIFNLRRLPSKIAKGDLDLILTKPIDSQFAVSLWRPYFALVPSLIPGFILIYLGFERGGFVFNPIMILPFLIIFISGLIIAYSLGMMITTLSFWLINANPLPQLAERLIFMKRNPFSVYTGVWRFIFLVILPLAFMVSFPAEILLGDFSWQLMLLGVGLAAIFLKGSSLFWNFGLRHYQSASS